MGNPKTRLLLAVDGSDQAFEAVRYASQLFSPDRVAVVLFSVISKIPETFWDFKKNPAVAQRVAMISAWEIQQQRELEEFMERARRLLFDRGIPEGAVEVKMRERKVGIARDIVREAQGNYSAVVVGRWGTSKLKDLVLGSIASKLVGRLSKIPVCVIGGAPLPGKILVALDGSKEAMRTVDCVGAMVAGTDFEVTLFHVIRSLDDESRGHRKHLVHHSELEAKVVKEFQQAESSMEAVFEKAINRLSKSGVKEDRISNKIVTGVNSRAKAIVDEAQNGGYGTIFVGRRGLSRVTDFFMGRVSNKVIQLAKEMAVWVVA